MKRLRLSAGTVFLLAATLLVSCGFLPDSRPEVLPPSGKCWLLEAKSYQFRQSIRLEWSGRVENFEAFTALDLQSLKLRQVVFNQLGVTLLKLEIDCRDFSAAGPLSATFAGRRLTGLLVGAWRRIYLDLEAKESGMFVSRSGQRPEFTGQPARMVSLKGSSGDIEFADFRRVGSLELPYKIVLRNRCPEYTLAVRLLTVEEGL